MAVPKREDVAQQHPVPPVAVEDHRPDPGALPEPRVRRAEAAAHRLLRTAGSTTASRSSRSEAADPTGADGVTADSHSPADQAGLADALGVDARRRAAARAR